MVHFITQHVPEHIQMNTERRSQAHGKHDNVDFTKQEGEIENQINEIVFKLSTAQGPGNSK